MIMIVRAAALAGSLLASARTVARLNQTRLADRSGVAASQISKYEMSIVTPSLGSFVTLLKECGFRLVAMTWREAMTYKERERVIAEARRFVGSSVTGQSLHDLAAAVTFLDNSERECLTAGDDLREGPVEELVRLRAEVELLRATAAVQQHATRAGITSIANVLGLSVIDNEVRP